MRVISFNTFSAPTMRGRFVRKVKINRAIHKWLIEGVDVIGLQELNSFTIGFLGWIYFHFQLYHFLHEQLARFVDVLLIVEGYIFPWGVYNNTHELEYIIDQHNIIQLDPMKKYYIYKSDMPNRGVSAGVVTIIKYKPETIAIDNLPSDIIHKPGYICIRYLNNIIFNAHFVPNLPNKNRIYRMINWLNSKYAINKKQIRLDNIATAHSVVLSMISRTDDSILMIGDYNICRDAESILYKKLISKFGLVDSALIPICTQHTLYGCIVQQQQIDYILSNKQPIRACVILKYLFSLSDHYAIDSEY
jgi:hypothetical protein